MISYLYTSSNGFEGDIQVEIGKGIILVASPPKEIEEEKRQLLLDTLTVIALVTIVAIATYMLVSVRLMQKEQLSQPQ